MLFNDAGSTDTKVADDGSLDPNLQLMQQQQAATSPTSTTPLPTLPPPPPLPPDPSTTPTSTAPTTQQSGSITAPPPPAPDAPPTAEQQLDQFSQTAPTTTASSSLTPPPLSLGDAAPTPATPTAATGLPQGFTMGDPTSSNWGASYYNGQKVIGNNGANWILEGGATGPAYDPAVERQITDAANAAYLGASGGGTGLGYSYLSMLDPKNTYTSTDMRAILADPEWQKLQNSGPINYASLSPELQAKIKAVPNLYNSLIGNTGALTPSYAGGSGVNAGPARTLQNGLETYADGSAVPGGYNALTDLYRQLGTTPGTVNPQVLQLVQQNPALIGTLTPDQQTSIRTTLQSMGISLPTSGASGIGTPSSGLGTTIGSRVPLNYSAVGGASGASGAAGGSGGPYSASNVAIGSTILPNADPRLAGTQGMVDAAAKGVSGIDRVALAKSMFDNFAQSSAPQYQAALRSATQRGGAAGQIGSGQLRTSYGDLANQRNQQLQEAQTGFMNTALEGTVQDQLNKLSALSGLEGQQFGQGVNTNDQLRTERGYQGSLEQQAFDRALQQFLLQQQTQQQQFQNGLSLTQVGSQQDPASYYMALAQQYGLDPSLFAMLGQQMGAGSVKPSSTSTSSYPAIPAGYAPDYTLPAGQLPA